MTDEQVSQWFAGRLPAWFSGPADVTVDRDEVVVIGQLADAEGNPRTVDSTAEAEGHIARFRAETRKERMGIADEAEARFGRKVAWGARCGEVSETFTSLSVPVMTRLRQPLRLVLDTLVDAGVARSRSDALAWCVRLVGSNEAEWLGRLDEALRHVKDARAAGPQ